MEFWHDTTQPAGSGWTLLAHNFKTYGEAWGELRAQQKKKKCRLSGWLA